MAFGRAFWEVKWSDWWTLLGVEELGVSGGGGQKPEGFSGMAMFWPLT